MQITIGEYLFSRLKQAGIARIFGVPGDYNLQLLEQIPQVDGLEFVGNCNELNAAYAADGYARLNGIGAVLTTYGVGELSAICGVAGSCAEHVPVVCVTGAPPLYATRQRWLLHHSLGDGNFDNMLTCYRQFTAAQARLTPANAAEEIDRALRVCVREKRPVYIQVPSDISFLTIDAPEQPLDLTPPASDPERLRTALERILALLKQASKPALLLDMDAERFGFDVPLRALVDKIGLPYATLSTGKGILGESDPHFLGLYGGRNSAPGVRERIEQSDCLFITAPRFTEGNSGMYSQALPAAATVNLGGYDVSIGGEVYQGIATRELLEKLVEAAPAHPNAVAPAAPVADWLTAPDDALTQARLWPRLARFIRPDDVVIAESGTSNIGLTTATLPPGVSFVTANIWGAIGYSLPALLGAMLAAPHRRHLLFIGDGSFQLTAQELSTLLRLDLKPVIFLLNNRGYTIERFILGMRAAYNDVANWRYARLPAVFAEQRDVLTLEVATEGELEEALKRIDTDDRAAFIELHLDPFDAPASLKKFGPGTAAFDFGPRGPQTSTS